MHNTSLLDEYRRGKKQKAEIIRNETVKRIHDALKELSKKIHFKNAYIFGSILKPYFSDESDIDIAFEGLKNEDFFKAMAFLADYLGRDVDVIQIEGHRLKDKIVKEGTHLKV